MKCGGAGSITCCLTLLPTWWLLLNDAVISASSISEEANSLESCDRSRVILKQPWGVFGDGPGKYRPNTYCQWLIIANSSSRFIHLSFRELKTECSYDHVFVHDGDSVDSPLLAGLSGDTVPRQPIVASSGKMLVLLFSDTNYFLEGFNAEYSVSDCMFNCSGHGLCADHECVCDELYSGDACENPLCPDDCGEALGRGVCDLDKKKCRCSVHFAGTACDLPAINDDNARWIMLARGYQGSDAFMPSTAMSGVYSTLRDTFYVFGGYDLNSVNDQLFAYDFSFGLWVEIIPAEPSSALPSRRKYNDLIKFSVDNNTVSVRLRDTRQVREYKRYFPRGRFGHAMAYLEPDLVVLYGGEFSDGSHSDELWTYNVTSNIWILVNTTGVKPPPLSKHTLTIVGDNTLYLFGGSKSYGEFSSDMYRLNMSWNPLKWERVRFRGGKAEELRLVGHTAVYYAASNSLIVYGGIAVNLAKFSVLSDKMFVFDVETSFWSELSYPRGDHYDHFVPMKRAFHSAQIIGNFMVIFGGYSHHHNQEEKCYDDRLYLYHLGCHTWISPSVLKTSQDSLAPGVLPSWVPVGRYSHASAVRLNHTLLIAGGFHGNVDGNFIALIFPTSFVSNGSKSIAKCSMYKDRAVCSSNPECGWCEPEMVCLDRTAGANCTGNLQSSHCPGICPSITDCVSCMIHRRDTFDDHSVAGKKKLLQCHWCVQNAYCHARHDVGSLCGTEDETVSGTTGWWGPKGDEVSSVEECVRKDRRPGLTLLVYKHPKDLDHPDEVSIINSTMETFTPQSYLRETGPPTARMFGYLHPLGNKPSSGEPDLQVSMSVANAVGVLKIGSNDSNASLEVVGNQTTGPTREVVHRVTARRPGGGPMFSNSSRGSRYLLDFEVMQKPSGSSTFKMRLDWNQISGSGFGIPRFNKEITYEFLEPYSNGSCKSFRNCLACLSDAECAWCDATATCLRRNDAGTAQCGETPLHLGEFLRLDPSLCPLCSDHISCFACVSAGAITGRPWCEWLVEEATCVRRGKTPESLIASGNLALAVARDSTECPVPCHARLTCTDCLDLPGKCSWCAARKECFVFSVFTSRFQYAQCRDWTDEDAALQPHEDAVGGPMFGGTRSESEDSKCRRCETAWNCSTCLKRLGCGWCYNQDNPTIGVCVGGDFTGPRQGTCEDSIRQARRNSTMELAPSSRGDQPSAMALIAIEAKSAKEDLNVTLSTGWAYDVCSDVDECRLGLHDCHPDAECLNTRGHFRCACKRGFAGDGRSVCERTCFDECVHGHCSGAPEFKCQCPLGWTGTDCSQDCKCRGHSTCKLGIGICDECKFLTRGEFCDECVPGSFGNASSLQGCRRCFCNGHGDEDKGVCDPVSGTCFCRDNTAGRDCHRCKEGFYGDPRNGGLCYRKCKPRDFIHGTDSGGLGAFFGSSDEEHCLWIVSIFDSLEEATLHPPVNPAIIQLTIREDISVICGANHVYVYDGLPNVVSTDLRLTRQSDLLGVFCSGEGRYPITVEARSGYLTVYFRWSDASDNAISRAFEGFNASYEVFVCPDRCPSPRICSESGQLGLNVGGKCSCPEGTFGPKCEFKSCHGDCGSAEGFGDCNTIYGKCNCSEGRGGEDCSVLVTPPLSNIVTTTLFSPESLPDTMDHLKMILPRMAHSMVYDHLGSLWIFGGFSLSRGPLNDVQKFSVSTNRWNEVTVQIKPGDAPLPRRRYFHAAAYAPAKKAIFVHGGVGREQEQVFHDDFWAFHILEYTWHELTKPEWLPSVAGHSLTLRSDPRGDSLILIGGFSPDYGFLDFASEYSVDSQIWRELEVNGAVPVGIYGHSTVYHQASDAFYVFGGVLYDVDKVVVSSRLYTLYWPTKTWSILPVDGRVEATNAFPLTRFFHAAVTTNNYMLVFGGRTNADLSSRNARNARNNVPHDRNASIFAYDYACNLWLALTSKDVGLVGNMPEAVLAHAAVVTDGDDGWEATRRVYVFGGLSGRMRGNVLRLDLPADLCSLWNDSPHFCRNTPGCGYCKVYDEAVSGDEKFSEELDPARGRTFCVSNSRPMPKICKTAKRSDFSRGLECSARWLNANYTARSCYEQRTCSECLAVTPMAQQLRRNATGAANEAQACQWCKNCVASQCVPRHADAECANDNQCSFAQPPVLDAGQCPEHRCAASDCEKCWKLADPSTSAPDCFWTRQLVRTGVFWPTLLMMPVYKWNCIKAIPSVQSSTGMISMASPTCPTRCDHFSLRDGDRASWDSCSECLAWPGAEGGWHECHWALGMKKCMSPSFAPLLCVTGECGRVVMPTGMNAVENNSTASPGVAASIGGKEELEAYLGKVMSALVARKDWRSAALVRVGTHRLSLAEQQALQIPSSVQDFRFPLGKNAGPCPADCDDVEQCSVCLSNPACGWCTFPVGPVDGLGVCIRGALEGPLVGSCNNANFSRVVAAFQQKNLPLGSVSREAGLASTTKRNAHPVSTWHYMACPAEDECVNEHHDCDPVSEQCVDAESGYECRCSEGYAATNDSEGKRGECRPVCRSGCVHGDCVAPDKCACRFGYVGAACELECKCNGHSHCAGPDRLDECIQCRNHTTGPQCDKCEKLYVGDPRNNNVCIPCREYCNGHTDLCLPQNAVPEVAIKIQNQWSSLTKDALLELLREGASLGAVCVNCGSNTRGDKCDLCVEGHFRGFEDKRRPCIPCQCHGHGSKCDAVTGENCDCHNNTESDQGCWSPPLSPVSLALGKETWETNPSMFSLSSPPSPSPGTTGRVTLQPCWTLQCSRCRESYLGNPTNGHQCYRQMTVDTDFCFDPDTQSECDREPSPLLKGRTVFFAVQPKFRNVDIRITVDVLVGSLDVFLSSKEDAFVVDVNKTNGIHEISFDKKYGVYRSRYLHRSVKDMIQTDDEFLDDHVDEILGPDADRIRTHLRQTFAGSNAANIFRRRKKQKRPRTFSERLQPHPDESRGNGAAGAGNTTNRVPHRVVEHVAGGLSTYITIRSPYDFLIVRGVQNRLVITLPEEVHDLRSTRFYIVLYSVGTEFQPVVDKAFAGDKNGFDFTLSAVGAKEDPAFGSVFFRQDQPRIDLFVFFSVFFSSFFLLLAVCVVAWKVKRYFDVRRAQLRHVVEMQHMARRPFGRVCVLFTSSSSSNSSNGIAAAAAPEERPKRSRRSAGGDNEDESATRGFHLAPIAVEPCEDNVAGVGTVLVQLPGGAAVPSQLGLGSALVLLSRVYTATGRCRGSVAHGGTGCAVFEAERE